MQNEGIDLSRFNATHYEIDSIAYDMAAAFCATDETIILLASIPAIYNDGGIEISPYLFEAVYKLIRWHFRRTRKTSAFAVKLFAVEML